MATEEHPGVQVTGAQPDLVHDVAERRRASLGEGRLPILLDHEQHPVVAWHQRVPVRVNGVVAEPDVASVR